MSQIRTNHEPASIWASLTPSSWSRGRLIYLAIGAVCSLVGIGLIVNGLLH
ncbi:MAG: hypothetical protein H7146_10135 [Burkholderiaceae bacterium]|nr:hypothetical protein [Microbacteriaceae bacterium]